MIKTIRKIGDVRGLILDGALLQQTRLKEGDKVNVEVDSEGRMTITPLNREPGPQEIEEAIAETMEEYAETLKKLAQ